MNIKELRLKEISELRELAADTRRQLDDFKFKAHQGQLKEVREIRVAKKDLARIETVLTEKQK